MTDFILSSLKIMFYIKSSLVFHGIVHLENYISKCFENNYYTLGVFIDLTKAFDTVDHNILLKKLFHHGVRGNTLKTSSKLLTEQKTIHCLRKLQ